MSKQSNTQSEQIELVSEKFALRFSAELASATRRVLASCIDGEISALGLPDGVRAGSDRFLWGLRKAVSEVRAREIDLEELGREVMPAIEEGLDAHDQATRDAAKKRKRLIDRYAEFLEEDAKERNPSSTFQEEWDEAA